MKFVLASQSPRRRELLEASGIGFEICPPSESVEAGGPGKESTAEYVHRLAREKAVDVAKQYLANPDQAAGDQSFANEPRCEQSLDTRSVGEDELRDQSIYDQRTPEHVFIIACDTVADCDGVILEKPLDREDARQMLSMLSGRAHKVWSGLCLHHHPTGLVAVATDVSELSMTQLDVSMLEAYLDSNAWQGKSGAFGYQDGHPWLTLSSGSASNVVGLPMELLARMLADFLPTIPGLSIAPPDLADMTSRIAAVGRRPVQ